MAIGDSDRNKDSPFLYISVMRDEWGINAILLDDKVHHFAEIQCVKSTE